MKDDYLATSQSVDTKEIAIQPGDRPESSSAANSLYFRELRLPQRLGGPVALNNYTHELPRCTGTNAIHFSPPSTDNSEELYSSSFFFLQSELLNKNVLSYCFGKNLHEINGLSRYENSLKAYCKYASSRIPAPDQQAPVAYLTDCSLYASDPSPESYCLWGVA